MDKKAWPLVTIFNIVSRTESKGGAVSEAITGMKRNMNRLYVNFMAINEVRSLVRPQATVSVTRFEFVDEVNFNCCNILLS